MKTRILFALFAAAALPAAAQVSLQPQAPRVHDTVEIHLDGSVIGEEWAATPGPELTMSGNRITVTLPLAASGGIPANLDWALGNFPAGSYQVEVVKRAANGTVTSVAQTSFNVAARTGNVPRTSYSDLWWNPDESGWGLNVQQHPNDQVFATWFVYGLDGRPQWFVLPGGQWTSEHEFTGTVYRTRGTFFQDPWNPANLSVIPAGSATLQFLKYDALAFSYTIDGVPGQKSLIRQRF
jgi:hypothetical protein